MKLPSADRHDGGRNYYLFLRIKIFCSQRSVSSNIQHILYTQTHFSIFSPFSADCIFIKPSLQFSFSERRVYMLLTHSAESKYQFLHFKLSTLNFGYFRMSNSKKSYIYTEVAESMSNTLWCFWSFVVKNKRKQKICRKQWSVLNYVPDIWLFIAQIKTNTITDVVLKSVFNVFFISSLDQC